MVLSTDVLDSPLIVGLNITLGWIFNEWPKHDQRINEQYFCAIKRHHVQIIGDGLGFLSRIYRVNFEFDDTHGLFSPRSLIIKLPLSNSISNNNNNNNTDNNKKSAIPLKGISDEQMKAILTYHNVEYHFYNEISPNLSSNFPILKLYAGKPIDLMNEQSFTKASIVLEDGIPCVVIGYFDTLNAKQVENVVSVIAHFHSWSLSKKAQGLLKSLSYEEMERREATISNISFQMLSKVEELAPGRLTELTKRLRPFINNSAYRKYLLDTMFDDLDLPRVYTHGDLWSHNILWKRNSDSTASNELRAIIDWQTFRVGNAMQDIARLLVNSCNKPIRHHVETYIFDFYKSYFDKNIREFFKDDEGAGEVLINQIATEKLKKAYNIEVLSELKKAIFYVPLMHGTLTRDVAIIKERNITKEELMESAIAKTIGIAEDSLKILEDDYPHWLNETVA